MCFAGGLEEHCEILWVSANELANTVEADKGNQALASQEELVETG